MNKEVKLSDIHAYDLTSSLDITNEVKETKGDLNKYILNNNKVTQTFSVRGVTFTINAYTKDTLGHKYCLINSFKVLKNKLLIFGDKTQDLFVGVFLFLLIILRYQLVKDKKKNL